jgi:mannose-6-phosphate isomerase-like protein (cupin superfamily)
VSIFRSGSTPPAWGELEHFDIVGMEAGETVTLPRRATKERILVAVGQCQVLAGARSQVLREGQFIDLAADDTDWRLETPLGPCRLLRFCGHWGDELGGCGLFSVRENGRSAVVGDPVPYAKNTGFDSHYHDCDEYWMVLSGAGTVVVGGRHFPVSEGDAVAIGMGHHHDFPEATEPVEAVYFETTLERQKRVGHLWEHTHGPADPAPERV